MADADKWDSFLYPVVWLDGVTRPACGYEKPRMEAMARFLEGFDGPAPVCEFRKEFDRLYGPGKGRLADHTLSRMVEAGLADRVRPWVINQDVNRLNSICYRLTKGGHQSLIEE